ncbi:unnamed protein product [Parnassius apollo]|uniref:(apollo) hypothetical protein n=1 Tax=Parnassius apollo TaxID=110799 RepID=A0A8S3XSQ5_PARAO|nr:unnamed protein product [Parnassius apollo]
MKGVGDPVQITNDFMHQFKSPTFVDPRGVLDMFRSDATRPRGDDAAVHASLPPGVHPALAPGAADLPQLPEARRIITQIRDFRYDLTS